MRRPAAPGPGTRTTVTGIRMASFHPISAAHPLPSIQPLAKTAAFEMDPGDVLFFHSNLLHASAENTSDRPRWSMICCYNAARNNPYKESHHPRYTPLHKVPDSAILEAGLKGFADSTEDVAWLEDKKDQSARSLEHEAAKHS